MKYLTIISLSTLAVLAAALPQGTNEVEDVEPVDIGTIPAMPDSLKDGAPVTSTAGDDVDPEKRGIEKRDFGIDIWQDPNQGGRHQTLHVNAQQCYNLELTVPGSPTVLENLKNFHFNDQISSFLCYNN
ncbi:hypothetical protein EKO04_006876 [Ascochyta lentis]|uniref:Uncharacterized protein n=1 Tax=Ascochyta lentis TaxID=205686 RepID=A0A8H7MJ31_9PLEO|nr:hypothetical protein EKO04_006876 [Ascochyta lentis]